MPVAAEVAAALGAQLEVVLVCKIGAPGQPELAVGAVGEDGVTVQNNVALHELGLVWADVRGQVDLAWPELRRRAACFRPGRGRPDLRGRTVIVVDDGIATGSTVVAALRVVRGLGATWVVLAVAVAPADATPLLSSLADEVVTVLTPTDFVSVGQWYDEFTPVEDAEAARLLLAEPESRPPRPYRPDWR